MRAFVLQKITGIPLSFIFYNGCRTKPRRADCKVCQRKKKQNHKTFFSNRNHFSIINQKQHTKALSLPCFSFKVLQPTALHTCYSGFCLSKQMEQHSWPLPACSYITCGQMKQMLKPGFSSCSVDRLWGNKSSQIKQNHNQPLVLLLTSAQTLNK